MLSILALTIALAVAVPAPALAEPALVEGSQLGTLMKGRYTCELPGPPGALPGRPDPASSFTITSSSRHIAADGSLGSYLRAGREVLMTSGALAGTRLLIVRAAFLRRIDPDGQPGTLRCVLSRASDTG